MPNQDGKGPVWGSGPKTGWGRGNCESSEDSQKSIPVYGFGRRCQCPKKGFGWKRFFSSKNNNNLEDLKEEEKNLQSELEIIQKEIKEKEAIK